MNFSTTPNPIDARRTPRLTWRVGVVGTVSALLTALAVQVPAQAASVLYVSASAASNPSCSTASQTHPFRTIAGALGCAANGTKINIGPGTFAGGFTITKNVTLAGAGAGTVIADPSASGGTLTEVTIADGHTVTLSKLTVDGSGQQADVVMGSGSLTITNATITGGVKGSSVAGAAAGGAVTVSPTSGRSSLTVLRSTLSNNFGLTGAGAIDVQNSSASPGNSVSVIGSTIAGNQGASAGAISMRNFNALVVRDSTISGNTGPLGGGLYVPGPAGSGGASTLTLTDSIVAGNGGGGSAADCSDQQSGISGGHNVVGVGDGCPAIVNGVNGDQAGTASTPLSPGLGALASNGGPTQTMALQAGSPAINAGNATDCLAKPVSGTDQRGVTRNVKTRITCDVGAYDTSVPLKTLYVKAGSGSDPSCASATAANPFRTIAGALGCAPSGTQINIGAGTFAGGFTITSNVVLVGVGPTTVISDPASGPPLTEVTVADGQFVSLRTLTVNGNAWQADVHSGSGALTIVSSTLTGGVAAAGAAVGLVPGSGTGSVLLLRSTVTNNLGLSSGPGAIFMADGNSGALNAVSIINSTLVGNQAGGSGGAVAAGYYDVLTVRDSTIAGNNAPQSGGGIYVKPNGSHITTVALTDVILAGNSASGHPGPDCSDNQGITDGGHTLLGVQDGTCPGIANGVNGDQAGTSGTPLNPLLGPLASNGGPTQTEALQTGSPARRAGDPTDCQAFPVSNVDQRGSSRHAGTRHTCDVGAYDTGS